MKYKLVIGWLYPDLMSTYGDRGNIIILQKRCEWRNIRVYIKKISLETKNIKIQSCDLLFMGGAQDRQQEIVNKNLIENKGKYLKKAIENNIPGLFICGAYQFLGKYYKAADGAVIKGLSVFDLYTEHPGGNVKRLIGDIIIKIRNSKLEISNYIVGFENHGGRTYIGKNIEPLGKAIRGFGNNGEDNKEGVIYKNSIGTYLHGPILSKNPEIADWLIKKALETKYKKEIKLERIEDSFEQKAKELIVKRYNIRI